MIKVYESPFEKIRAGKDNDGGYVICKLEGNYDLLISGGIHKETSFENQILDMYPHIICHAFDGTISSLPNDTNERIIFHKENLGIGQDLYNYMKDYNDIFLKIDIEGHENILLKKMIENQTIKKIKQLVVEFHAPICYSRFSDYFENLDNVTNDDMFDIIQTLNHTHKLVHIHVNNCPNHTFFEKDGIMYPEIFECTFIRYEEEMKLNKMKIPSDLDMPNCKNLPDVELNYYPFYNWITEIPRNSCKLYSSQAGQDGIIKYIFKNIGTTNKFFVEFGYNVNDYYYECGSNTGNLKINEGWTGVLFDIDNENTSINLFKETITAENINDIFEKYKVPVDVDYVSIDVDSIDLWIFKSLISSGKYKPRLISVEFNSNIDIDEAKSVINDPNIRWVDNDWCHGASIKALKMVGDKYNYKLVCAEHTLDLFFIRGDLIPTDCDLPDLTYFRKYITKWANEPSEERKKLMRQINEYNI